MKVWAWPQIEGHDSDERSEGVADVEVRLFAEYRKQVGVSRFRMEADDLWQLMEGLASRCGSDFLIGAERAMILINGRNSAQLAGMRTVLRDGDVVSFFPPLAGG